MLVDRPGKFPAEVSGSSWSSAMGYSKSAASWVPVCWVPVCWVPMCCLEKQDSQTAGKPRKWRTGKVVRGRLEEWCLSSATDPLSFCQLLQSSTPHVGLLVSSAASDSSSSATPELSPQKNENLSSSPQVSPHLRKLICSVLPLIISKGE